MKEDDILETDIDVNIEEVRDIYTVIEDGIKYYRGLEVKYDILLKASDRIAQLTKKYIKELPSDYIDAFCSIYFDAMNVIIKENKKYDGEEKED